MSTANLAPRAAARPPADDPFEARGAIIAALSGAAEFDAPYRHWLVSGIFTPAGIQAMRALPKQPVDLHGVSGKRELHNDQRHYFDREAIGAHPICAAIAAAFQHPDVVGAFEDKTGAKLSGSFVRLEHAHDGEGFWLQPHTDLGVKLLTLLCYLPEGPDQDDLGTDIFADEHTWAKRTPFTDGSALLFVPGTNTWHGFQQRPIAGVRTSLIMNYVTTEWRAREQLAFPDAPVGAR